MDNIELGFKLELLRVHLRRLRMLELREAEFGINTDAQVLIEMDDIREKVKDLASSIPGGSDYVKGKEAILHNRALIATLTRRLQNLEIIAAMLGSATGPEIVVEIEDIRAKIEQVGIEFLKSDEDLKYIYELMKAHKGRLRLLELRAAVLGSNADPSVLIEISDSQQKIQDVELSVFPGKLVQDYTEDVTHCRALIDKYLERLRALELQSAYLGGTAQQQAHIKIEIEDIKRKIEELKNKANQLEYAYTWQPI